MHHRLHNDNRHYVFNRAEDRFVADDTSSAASPADEDTQRAMTELCIHRAGDRYEFKGYRYDLLEDAMAYARLVRSRGGQDPQPQFAGAPEAVEPGPSDADRALMQALNIAFKDGKYRFGGFRYDRLVDAVSRARRHAAGSSPPLSAGE